ncbi:Dehydrogenase/reductase SDR member 11 [Homalodisca vitripennis]|nr:Dehydrogenase/reductase SDR member 11 [Homalodisca vitripennis]
MFYRNLDEVVCFTRPSVDDMPEVWWRVGVGSGADRVKIARWCFIPLYTLRPTILPTIYRNFLIHINMPEIAEELIDCRGKLYAVKADISKEEDIVSAFIWVEKSLGGVDILINSASVTASVPIVDGKSDEWKRIFDVNVYGPSICAREAVRSMKSRGVDDGYIININTLPPSPGGARDSILKASKLALTVLTDGLRAEFTEAKSRIKVTCVTPGAMTSGDTNKGTLEILRRQTLLEERHVAEMVTFILATPPNIQVSDLTLKPIASKPASFRPRLSK